MDRQQTDEYELAMDLHQDARATAQRETRFPMADFEDEDGRLPQEKEEAR